jgi:hypothetical protein
MVDEAMAAGSGGVSPFCVAFSGLPLVSSKLASCAWAYLWDTDYREVGPRQIHQHTVALHPSGTPARRRRPRGSHVPLIPQRF